jgi:transcriptional regulator with XRE-family HTH domain
VRRHSTTEIDQKLTTASSLTTLGISQQEICRRLEISVMTLHRWRKGARPAPEPEDAEAVLQENKRLRDIAASILIATQALRERYVEMVGKQTGVNLTEPDLVSRQLAQPETIALEAANG